MSTEISKSMPASEVMIHPDAMDGDIPLEERERITAILKRVKANSPVRQIANEVLTGNICLIDTIEPLISALHSKRSRKSRDAIVASWVLGNVQLSSAQRQVAAESLTHLLANKPPNPGWWVLAGCAFWPMMFFALIAGVFSAFSARRRNRVRAEAMMTLGRLGDPGCLGIVTSLLQETVNSGESDLRSSVRQAFPKIAAELTTDYYGWLPMQTVPNLCKSLNDPARHIAHSALAALEKIGDGRALEPVRRLAQTEGHHLQEMAVKVLPIIAERKSRETDKQTLLRAHEAPMDGSYVLLRPAGAGEGEHVEVLLRPVCETENP